MIIEGYGWVVASALSLACFIVSVRGLALLARLARTQQSRRGGEQTRGLSTVEKGVQQSYEMQGNSGTNRDIELQRCANEQ